MVITCVSWFRYTTAYVSVVSVVHSFEIWNAVCLGAIQVVLSCARNLGYDALGNLKPWHFSIVKEVEVCSLVLSFL